MKNNTSSLPNQQKVQNPQPVKVLLDKPELLGELSPTKRELLNIIFWYSGNCRWTAPSQSFLGAKVNRSRGWINKTLREFKELGIINYAQDANRSCDYVIASFFKNPIIQSRLSFLFRSFLKGSLVFLLSLLPQRDITLSIYKDCKDLNLILEKRRCMDTAVLKMMYGDSPIVPEIRSLPFSVEEQIRLTSIPPFIIKYVTEKFNKYRKRLDNPFNWFMSVCLAECKSYDIEPNWDYAKHISTMLPLFKASGPINANAFQEKESTAGKEPAAQRIYTDSKQTKSLKREGLRAHREWQGYKQDQRQSVSLRECASMNQELAQALKKLFNIDIG
jgi:hypothetical protein